MECVCGGGVVKAELCEAGQLITSIHTLFYNFS